MDRAFVIQSLLDKLGGKNYLEIGVDNRLVFGPIRAKCKIGVDPYYATSANKKLAKIPLFIYKWKRRFSGERFFKMTSDLFFESYAERLAKTFDVCFVDGLHTYNAAFKDVNNALNYLAPSGVVVMHDCSPMSASMATPAESINDPKVTQLKGWCGDVWKALVLLRTQHSDLRIFVLDADCGLGIVTRGIPENRLTLSKEALDQMSYEDLDKDRVNLLNLKPPEYLYQFLDDIHP